MSRPTETPQQAARRLAASAIRDGYKPEALHIYSYPDGGVWYWRIRLKHAETGDKWIRPMRLNGAGLELGEPDFPDGKPLYRLHDLTTRPDERVIVAEGELCVDRLAKLGVLATTSGAADSAAKANWQPLAERPVILWPDNDEAGQRYAEAVTDALLALSCTVRVIDIATLDLPPKGDAVDWLTAHPDAATADVWALPTIEPKARVEPECQERREKKSASTALVEIALSRYAFGVSTLGETFTIPKSGSKVVSMLRGGRSSLRGQLASAYFREYRRAASQQALTDALLVIDGMAQEKPEVELHLRVARHEGDLVLDIGDDTGRAIRVTGDGWTVEDKPAVLFKRTALTGALPDPVRGGNLADLWRLLNVSKPDRPLLAAWLVSLLFEDIPHPVLAFFGEQGTGKTTAQRISVSIIDPGPVPTRKPPRDPEAWVTAAAGSWVVAIDNMSEVQDWFSDSVCRAVTGDGDVRRKLYTDGEHAVFAFRRCICLNSIDLGALRSDLTERLLPIYLDVIPEASRRGEEDIWPRWREAHARILGAILDLASRVISASRSVEITRKPRMADFARVLAAVDSVLGTDGLGEYISRQTCLATDSLAGDPFFEALASGGAFSGPAASLLARVAIPDRIPRGWPTTSRAVTQWLRRRAPAMRKLGWKVSNDGGKNKDGVIVWSLTPPEIAGISNPPEPPTRQKQAEGGLAGKAGQEYRTSTYDEGGDGGGDRAAEGGRRVEVEI